MGEQLLTNYLLEQPFINLSTNRLNPAILRILKALLLHLRIICACPGNQVRALKLRPQIAVIFQGTVKYSKD